MNVRGLFAAGATALRTLEPRTVLAVGFALFVLYGFPGYMSTDSVAQLLEARSGHYSDAHPPLMSAIWRYLDMIIAGPLLMLLLQGALFLGGLYVLFQRVMTPRASAWSAVGVLLYPPVLTVMAVIWKDSQMAAWLVAGIAAILQPRLRTRVVGLVLLGVACAVRHNGLAAVVPVVVVLFEWRQGIRLWRRLVTMMATAIVLVGLVLGASRVLTIEHVRLTPVFHDIIGTIAYSDPLSDDELREMLKGAPVHVKDGIQAQAQVLWTMRVSNKFVDGDDRFFDYPTTNEDWSGLNQAWKRIVLSNKRAYFAYHWGDFADILGLNPRRSPGFLYNFFIEVPAQSKRVDHMASWSKYQFATARGIFALGTHTPLFLPVVYAVLALLLLVGFCRDRLTGALLVSGLLYELSFFPAAANQDYRYSHWMITSTCIATVLLAAQWLKKRRER